MTKSKTSFLVHFDQINVNAMETNSGVFVGTNTQSGWSSHNKTNTNISGISGDFNKVESNINVIYDNDGVDTPIDDRDIILSAS
jgi:hypothetical protein